jgi:uncharacterized protein YutE (UPF0331/DUF86 family)
LDNIILKKAATIERSILRIHQEYGSDGIDLLENFTKQDAIILNLQRAIQSVLDMGAHIIKKQNWGIPDDSRQIFGIFLEKKIIESELANHLMKMVSFRNIAVHEYQEINLDILHYIIKNRLHDILKFSKICLQSNF